MADSARGQNLVAYWKREIEAARKREQKYLEEAKRVNELYEAREDADSNTSPPFNILYSNTEIMLPALYNATPRPVCGRRFKDSDPLGLAASRACERSLQYLIDTPDNRYTPFDDLMKGAVLGALVPGRGVVRFQYDYEEEALEVEEETEKDIEAEGSTSEVGDVAEDAELNEDEEERGGKVVYETICGTLVPYDRVLFGYARTWDSMPWVGFVHDMTYADLLENFGKEVAEKVPRHDKKGELVTKGGDEEEYQSFGTAEVVEIWHKGPRKVLFICKEYSDAPLAEKDDPLKLTGFFPMVKPLQFIERVKGLVPRILYHTYEYQAKELNRISGRIMAVLEAVKVRGFYDGTLHELEQLLQKPDNTLLPAANLGMRREGATPANSIWLMPLNELVLVLQQLVMQREQCKSVIYEITGIADIMRGSSAASETLGAQKIKTQWGTMRLSRLQKRVQIYVRDNLRVMNEIASKQFSEETYVNMTELDYATTQEVQQAQQIMQQAQMAMMAMSQPPMMAPGQGPASPGNAAPQQPQLPQLPPQLQQAVQQAQAIMAKPKWEDVLALLRDDAKRNLRLDVETNSTIDPEATEEQQQIAELMTALGQLFQSAGPLVQEGVLPLGVMKSIMLTIARRYQFGPELEQQLEAMSDQMPPKQPDPEQDMKLKVTQAETQGKLAVMNKQAEIDQMELDIKKEELALKREELDQKRQLNQITFQGKMQAAQAKTAAANSQAQATQVTANAKLMQANTQAQIAAMQPTTPTQQ